MHAGHQGGRKGHERGAFRLLLRHFFAEFFETDLVTEREQLRILIVGILAALAGFGPTLAGKLAQKYTGLHFLDAEHGIRMVRLAGTADVLFFICFSMGVAAFVAALQWDLLFPGEHDYNVLMPLPIPLRTVLAAKLTALVGFGVLFIAAASVPMSGLLPGLMSGRWLRPQSGMSLFIAAQFVSTALAGAFCLLVLVGTQGILMQLLPWRLFRRLAPVMQMVLVVALLCSVPLWLEIPNLWQFMDERPFWGLFAPPVWFLGLYQTILGSRETYVVMLAQRALVGTVFAAAVTGLLYAVGYRRHARRVLESAPGTPRRRWWEDVASRVVGWIAPQPESHAVFSFVCRTLARSRRHKVILAAYVGVAFATVIESILSVWLTAWLRHRPPNWNRFPGDQALVSSPIFLAFFVLLGMRHVFSIPADLPANWVFRLTENERRARLLDAVERLLLVSLVAVWCVSLPFEIAMLGPWRGVEAVVVSGLLTLPLVEALLRRFAKVPFTCAYVPAKMNPTFVITVYVGTFILFGAVASALVIGALRGGLAGFLIFAAIFGSFYAWLRSQRRDDWGVVSLSYDDALEPAVRTLGLSTE